MSDLNQGEKLTHEQIISYVESCPDDGKGHKVVPDEFFNDYYRDLPNGTLNQSGTFRAYNGGKLGVFGGDPEEDLQKQRLGREAQAAAYRQRRSFKDQIDIVLANKDKNTDKTGVESVVISMYEKAVAGDVKAAAFLRDTVGEQPVTKQEIKGEIMTDADKTVIENALKRLKNRGIQADDPSI